MSTAFARSLCKAASAPYGRAGWFAWCFARGKLLGDPVFRILLEQGLLSHPAHLLDLGCGKGLLASLLRVARCRFEAGEWPAHWPEPPNLTSYRGIEKARRDVLCAQRALGEPARIELGDIRTADFGAPDAIVLLDVLHYLDEAAQNEVLERARRALPAGGILLLRVGNADGGFGFTYSTWVDHIVSLCRGNPPARLTCRSAQAWQALLSGLGYSVEVVPMQLGTAFSNVLFLARVGP